MLKLESRHFQTSLKMLKDDFRCFDFSPLVVLLSHMEINKKNSTLDASMSFNLLETPVSNLTYDVVGVQRNHRQSETGNAVCC